jgi:ankyrin repeat protein
MPDGRDQAIYKSIIQDKNGFLAYVSFMLSNNYSESCFEQYEIARQLLDNADSQNAVIPTALYERMLFCTVNNPYRLLDLDNLMNKLDEDLITDDFMKMYLPFKEIAKRMVK